MPGPFPAPPIFLREKPWGRGWGQINARPRKKMRPGHCTKKNPSRVSWVDLSRDRYIALLKLVTPAGNTFAPGLLFTWDKANYIPVHASKWEKKETCKRWCLHFAIFLTLGKFQFSKRKSLIDHDDNDDDNINNKHQFYRLAKHALGMCITLSHLTWLFI